MPVMVGKSEGKVVGVIRRKEGGRAAQQALPGFGALSIVRLYR